MAGGQPTGAIAAAQSGTSLLARHAAADLEGDGDEHEQGAPKGADDDPPGRRG